MLSTDAEAFNLRKRLSQIFYDTYYKVFMKVMKDDDVPTPIVQMFLNFGFMMCRWPARRMPIFCTI